MYLRLGQSKLISDKEILGILDLDNASWAYKTREFLNRAEKEGRAVWLSDDLPRSFVAAGGGKEPARVYLCQSSSSALAARLRKNKFE